MTRLIARAKLTLSLRVTGVRNDGYHLIDAEMVSLDLHDVVEIDPARRTSLVVDGPYAAGVPTDSSNLLVRALDSAGRSADVRLTKNIPHGGGLGGGSTDAAAVLRWAGDTDLARASLLGADVPFCIVGGRARVTGIGETVDPLAHVDREITLFVPPVRVSTPLVYKTWDEMGGPSGDLANDLEPAALRAVPELARWRDKIGDCIGERPHLAGSGATWFVLGHKPDAVGAIEGAGVILTRSAKSAD